MNPTTIRRCHALKEPSCVGCTGYDPHYRYDLEGPCRHALWDEKCTDCKGRPWERSPETPPTRAEIISAASIDERLEIKKWKDEWKALRLAVCHWCARSFSPRECHADHVIPLSRGGVHALGNLVISCKRCNLRKNALMPEVWARMVAAL